MELGVQRSDPIQRNQTNGPRVSFNRDVHVKRIGTRPNETENYPVQTTNLQPPQNSKPPLRRELPADRSEESILKEAALVLKQAESVKCTAEGGSDIVGGRVNEKSRGRIQQRRDPPPIPNKFHSLPTRKKKSTKPVSRSVSDVSSKKPKKPSIFSIFSRKSEPNLDQLSPESKQQSKEGKRVVRSKSDAGSSKEHKTVRTRNLSENEDSVVSKQPVPLSPIIENSQREDYFAEEDLAAKETAAVKPSNEEEPKDSIDQRDSKSKSPAKGATGNIGFTQQGDLDLIPSKAGKDSSKEPLKALFNIQSKSLEDMHCSQLPADKPPLTKGLTVDGMVKRLSMERFSPPPHLSSPGFSYTRPTTEQVIYAQVVCDNDNKVAKQTVHSNLETQKDMESPSHRYPKNSVNQHRSTIERSVFPSHNNKSEVYVNEQHFETRHRSYSPQQVTTTIRATSSPQHWKQSPRNLSDEDEGLGFEPRKYFEEEIPRTTIKIRENRDYDYDRRKSPSEEPPIIPVIRNLSPINVRLDVADRGRADGMDSKRREYYIEPQNEFNDLSYRRAALESKIRNRRFGSVEPESRKTPERQAKYSPERSREYRHEYNGHHHDSPKYYREERRERYISPDPESIQKFHKLNSNEIVSKYSPERTHLDMISPARDTKTSRYRHTKFYDDGHGGVRETYEKETTLDEHGQPHTRESRRRERLDSPKQLNNIEIPSSYEQDQFDDRYRHHEYEPKSFDSQFSEAARSSPENQKRGEHQRKHEEQWQNSLKRDKRQQRSFDKGDSGIENDFRKESFNGELTSKWRKRTTVDEIKTCETFLKKERRHTEELHRKRYDFVYRERSIDDGSHFDPRLDKYPKGTLRKKNEMDRYSSPNREDSGTLKREKKRGGLEKVKQLFTGSSKKKEAKELNGKVEPGKDRYMVREEEMRQRYNEYKPHLHEPAIPDIATRRRLSTPKASPLLKRTSSQKTPKPSPLALRDDNMTKAEKAGWFKSIDRRTKKKANQKAIQKSESPTRTPVTTTTEDEFSTLRVKKSYRTPIVPPAPPPAPPVPEKNLRFFGDTDQESNPSFSRAASAPRARPSVMALNRNQKHSQSAYHLDRITKPITKSQPRSNSLQNLDDGMDEVDRPRRRQQHSRSRNLDDISESASDSELPKQHARHTSTPRLSTSRDQRDNEPTIHHQKRYYEEHTSQHHRNSHDREQRRSPPNRGESADAARIEFRKPPPGPPKPARSADRRNTYSRERERLHDSSGTEGDSSLQSQRSVVYLHATTVGAIPQPYHLNSRRRAMSREELSALKSKEKLQPMTRTVSRSVSMLAPWKPKHLHEGYEINYSQEPSDKSKKHSTMPRKSTGSSSNHSKSKKTSSSSTIQRSKKYSGSSKDDLSSTRPSSSLTSASKSGISSDKKSSSDLRKDTLNRRKIKL